MVPVPNHPGLADRTPEARPYWEAAAEGRLVVQYCERDDAYVFPPRVVCPYCYADSLVWRESEGTGSVFAYSVVHQHSHEHWSARVPYVNALVELDEERVFLYSEVVNCPPGAVTVGMQVEVTFDRVAEDLTLPKFEPAEPEPGG